MRQLVLYYCAAVLLFSAYVGAMCVVSARPFRQARRPRLARILMLLLVLAMFVGGVNAALDALR